MSDKVQKSIIVILSVLCLFLIIMLVFLMNSKKGNSYISDMYVIDKFLILEGNKLENLYLQQDQENFMLENMEDTNQFVVNTEYLIADEYYLVTNNKTELQISSNMLHKKISFNNKTFSLMNQHGRYVLIKEKNHIQYPDYDQQIINELQQKYTITDFILEDSAVFVSITADVNADILLGVSNDRTNQVYLYESVQQQVYISLKKNTYKIQASQEDLRESRLYIRVLPHGADKKKVKSKQVLFRDLLEPEEQKDATKNNIKVV